MSDPMAYETSNAIIDYTKIVGDEHGTLTVWVGLDYGDSGHQGFGGYALYLPKGFKYHKLESAAGHFIYRVMEVAAVEEWSQLVGKTVRVRHNRNKVFAIGHITKNDWFSPSDDFSVSDEKEATA